MGYIGSRACCIWREEPEDKKVISTEILWGIVIIVSVCSQ